MLLSLLAALVAASAPAAPAADASKAYPFPVEMHTLPNGLRVAFIQYDAPGLVAYYTLMRWAAAMKWKRAARDSRTSSST